MAQAAPRRYPAPMAFTVSIHHNPGCLLVACAGPARPEDLYGVMALAGEVTLRGGYDRLLLDLLAAEFRMPITLRTGLGMFAAQKLSGVHRLAIALPPEQYTGLAERMAQSAALQVQVFQDLESATAWVMGS